MTVVLGVIEKIGVFSVIFSTDIACRRTGEMLALPIVPGKAAVAVR
ncbi:hypothetical protein AB7B99_28495 [Klebsiella pneumoniae]